jgi:hypothetical protein
MSDLERAKLIPVSGNDDTPDMNNAVDVQFNPVTLKVSLSNTLKPNTSQSNSRATQFVDKSSSTLTIELVFDTTYIETPAGDDQSGDNSQSDSQNQIEQGSDVREQTRKIADKFMKPVESGSQMQAPSRVLFQWGSFEFVGMVQSYDETLDFFSPKGRPLRATVSLKLSEDRYQFRSNDSAAQDAEQSPTLSFTGNSSSGGANQDTGPVPGSSADGAGSWRDNAMFNGIETPRLPSVSALALPSVELSAGVGFGISGGAGIGASMGVGVSGGISVSGGVSASISASVNLTGTSSGSSSSSSSSASTTTSSTASSATAASVTPGYKYGNSSALGTNVPGAFSPNLKTSLKASSLQQGSQQLRAQSSQAGSSASATKASAAGATQSKTATSAQSSAVRQNSDRSRTTHGTSVTSLLKKTQDSGVGFD